MAQPDRFAAIRRFFRIFNNPLPDNRFQDSFGVPISDFNDQSRWALAGKAAQVWDKTIRPLIDAYDGDIYGVLFACSASLNEGYIVPFHLVLDSIMTITNASKIALPSRSVAECAITIYTNSSLHVVDVKSYSQKRQYQNFQESAHTSSGVEEDKTSYLSTFDISCLIINKMVGTGVFTAPQAVFLLVGVKTVAFILWILGFIFTLISLMIYLSYGTPYSGGELIYLDSVISRSSKVKTKPSLPKSMGFIFDYITHVLRSGLFSYVLYAAIFLTSANSGLSSLQFSRQVLTSSMSQPSYGSDERFVWLLALMLLIVTCLIFCFPPILGQILGQLTAMTKVALLIGILVARMLACLNVGDGLGLDIVADDIHWRNVPAAFLLVLFSFQGWDTATFVAGETGPNRRSVLRRQSLLVVVIVGLFYVCINTAFLYGTPPSPLYGQNSVVLFETPYRIGFNATQMTAIESPFWMSISPDYGFVPNSIISFTQIAWLILITLSSLGNMMATLYTSSRVAHEIDAANVLPWSRLSKRTKWSTQFHSTYFKHITSGGLLVYFYTSCAVLATAILSESLNTTSSLYYLSTFAQCNWILILTLALWRHKRSRGQGYLIHFGYCIFILSTLLVIIGVGIPSDSPAGTAFASWKLQLTTVTIIGVATVYYLLVFASASIYDSSTRQWREPAIWRWSVLGIAGVKCEIRPEEDLVQGTGLKHHSRRRATFLKADVSLAYTNSV